MLLVDIEHNISVQALPSDGSFECGGAEETPCGVVQHTSNSLLGMVLEVHKQNIDVGTRHCSISGNWTMSSAKLDSNAWFLRFPKEDGVGLLRTLIPVMDKGDSFLLHRACVDFLSSLQIFLSQAIATSQVMHFEFDHVFSS